jgi:HK97 family phage major capsid protein
MNLEELKKAIHDVKDKAINKEKAIEMMKVALAKSITANRKSAFALGGRQVLGVGPQWFTKAEANATEMEFQKKADDIYLLGVMLGVNPRQTQLFESYAQNEEFKKAMDTTEHADWVPTQLSASLQAEIHLALKVAALHDRITMPTQPYDLPYVAGRTTGYLAGEATEEDSSRIKKSKMTAGKVRFDAVKIAARVILTEEMVEDAIIPALPLLKKDIVAAIATSIENATINGDTSTTHLDTGETVESYDARRAWMGYRKLSQAALDIGGTLTAAKIKILRGLMGVYGVDPNKIALVCSMQGYLKLTDLEEVKTLDKYGPKATVITGELAKIDNIPIVVSEWARDDLNAEGIYDGAVETFTQLLMVYKDAMLYGDRRNVTVRTDFDIERDQNILVATQRLAFS